MTERTKHVVCSATDLPPGEQLIVTIEGRSIGGFNVDGGYYAMTNVCPHQRAPLCEGELTGTTRANGIDEVEWVDDGQIVICP